MKKRKKYTLSYINKNRKEEVSFYDYEYMSQYFEGLKRSPLAHSIKLTIRFENVF